MCKTALALTCCLAAPAFAQPTTMVYQGTLTGLGGDPVTASVPMTFRVFAQETGGAALWTESLDIDVEDGFFAIVLGETQALVESLFPANADRWLEIAVDGTALTPRQVLGSAPWALVCGDAQTVGGGMTPLTSVTSPGGTLTAGGAGGSRTLDVDYSVMGSCADPTNDKVVGIDPGTGAVQCMSDLQGPGVPGDITAVLPGVGLDPASGGTSGSVTLDLEIPVNPFIGGTGLLGSVGTGDTYLRSDGLGGWFESGLDGNHLFPGTVALDKLASSGCAPGQVATFDGLAWGCGAQAAVSQWFQGGFGTMVGAGVDTLLASTSVSFPANGMALIMAEANFLAGDADKWLSCHLAEDGLAQPAYYWDAGDADGWYDLTQSHVETKPVSAGLHTYELFCNWNSAGSVSDVSFGYPQVVVAFFPAAL